MILSFEAGLPVIAYLDAWLSGGPPPPRAPIREGLRLLRRWHDRFVE